MPDRIKKILDKVLAWWNKFTTKQKTIIVGASAAVIFTFAILIWAFTRPQYTQFQQCSSTAEASKVIEILDSNSIEYKTSTDGLRIQVKNSQLSAANLALGAAGYIPDDYTLDEALSGGFSSTQSDTQKRYANYLEKQLVKDICNIESVNSATVKLNIPDNTGTLIATDQESSAWIQLSLKDKFTQDQALTVAKAVATALGNTSTANITITDTNANLLFSGEEDYSTAGVASNMLELRSQAESLVGSEVKKVMVGSRQFDMVEVACRLDIDFSEYEKTVHEYYANSGRDEGMLSHRETTEDTNTSGSGGIPGTDSNNETTYQYKTGTDTESSSTSKLEDFLPNESLSVQNLPAGVINYGNSSLSLTAISYRVIKEEDAKSQGLLDGITWDQYKAANDAYTKMDVDQDFYSLVSTATGIPAEAITIMAYEVPQFIDKEGAPEEQISIAVSVILVLLILAILAFVIIRSMMAGKEVQKEEELSVESLLQSTPDETVEDIELESKSETRKMIEKFVDENPEAAANLLRNWLNEDWG